jgi:hypothetical protein
MPRRNGGQVSVHDPFLLVFLQYCLSSTDKAHSGTLCTRNVAGIEVTAVARRRRARRDFMVDNKQR